MTFPYLSVKNLQCTRNYKILFASITFEIDEGEVFHIRGENGVGKTTLLRSLVGLSQPYSGAILLKGQKIEERDLFKANLLYLGHKIGIKESLTAFENLLYNISMPALNEHKINSALSKVGLLDKKDVFASNLSAGQKQRLALTRLVLSSAKLWILDEPFSSLDQRGISLAQTLIQDHIENEGMVIFTSHQALTQQFDRQKTIDLLPCLQTIDQGIF